jgi:hypothetical protein
VARNGVEELEAGRGRLRCAYHIIIGHLRAVCNDDGGSAAETRRRIARRGMPGGGNYYRCTYIPGAIRLPPLIVLGGRDLPKIAPKWLVTSESNGINDCCAGVVGEIAAVRLVSSYIHNSLDGCYHFLFPFLFVLQRFLSRLCYDKKTKKQFLTKNHEI